MRNLKEIKNFGNIDAQLDDLLEACFEEHTAYKEFLSFDKFLIIGKKGSGKTAIYEKVIKISESHIFSDGYNLRSYPWHHHSLQENTSVTEEEKYVHSWEYLILMAIAKLVITRDQSIKYDQESIKSMEILESFIKDSYGSIQFDITHLFTPKRKLRFKPFLGLKLFDKEVGLELPVESYDMEKLPVIIEAVNRTIEFHLFRCLNPEHKYYICFDELDFGFNKEGEYVNQLIGLIRAAYNIRVKALTNSANINIGIFLRDDIYNVLNFEDKRKITQNFACKVEWDSDESYNTLKQLMENRFNEVLSDSSDKITWEDVFDETKRINGQVLKYDYMKELTCLRPRDIIDLCNCVLTQYKKKNRNDNIFTNEDITDAKIQYSRNLFDEFKDEIFKHIPDYMIYFEMIKDVGKSKFSYDELNISYEKFKDKLTTETNLDDILKNLFEYSIIGNYKIGGKRGGSKKVFKYTHSDDSLIMNDSLIVHAGLVQYLNLKSK